MINKFKQIYQQVKSRVSISLTLFAVVALAITWGAIGQIEYNYRLEQRQQELQQRVALLQQQKSNQGLRNQFFETDYYLDLAARRQLGLVKEGQRVTIVSQSRIDQLLAKYPANDKTNQPQEDGRGKASPLEQWLRFFSGKTPL